MSYCERMARIAYDAYRAVLDAGMPEWPLLSDVEKSGWRAAARALLGGKEE